MQPADAWPGYDPDGLSGQPAPLAVLRAGRVAQLGDDRFAPVDGVAGTGQPPVLRPAVSLDSSQLAAVSADGRRLLVGPVTGDDPLQPVLGTTELAVPSWDPSGNLWAVDRFNGRVWVVPRGTGQPVAVGLPRLGPGRVVGLRVSRDGARAALTVADGTDLRLLVAIVLRDPDTTGVRLTQPAEVLPALGEIQDVAWSDATTLAVLGSSDGEAVSPLLVDISGFLETPVETVPDLVRLTAAPPGRPLIAGTRTGRLLTYSSSGGWVSLGAGSDPAYPG